MALTTVGSSSVVTSPKRPVVGDVAQEPAHDLAAAGLGQLGRQQDLARLGDGADLVRHVVPELGHELLPRLAVDVARPLEGDEGHDGLAGGGVVGAHHGRLGHGRDG